MGSGLSDNMRAPEGGGRDCIVHTPCGPVRGCPGRLPGTVAYKGIRYARAERWQYPVEVESWEGVYDATRYGHCCYQPRAFYNEAEDQKKSFYYREFRAGEEYTYSEDCLFLNIWTPEDAEETGALPVIVYIHGGGFTGGCGHEKHFDGPVWPRKGAVAVTVNYRLGPLGFACLPQLEEEAGHTGNYGLFDQLAALRWVRRNIAAFGGDPENITLMGQSAGAMSVQQHCLSPLSRGLFHRAVMSSGGGVSRLMVPSGPEKGYAFWQAVMDRAGCGDLADFRALSPAELFSCWQETKKTVKGGACAPCMDGRLVVGAGADILAAGQHSAVPCMAGTTSEDVMPPLLFSMSRGWCARQEQAFTWFFDRRLPGDDKGAWHSSDLWYWFGTLDNCWRPMTERDRALSGEMTDYLVNFARCGDPNGPGLPRWEGAARSGRRVLRLGEGETRMGKVNMPKLIATMLTHPAVGE